MMAKYSKMNDKIERISKRIYTFVLGMHIASLMLFSFLKTAINYIIYDFGDESYYLKYFAM